MLDTDLGWSTAGLPAPPQSHCLMPLLIDTAGCQQLDYDMLCDVMTSCAQLQHLDLQQATIILHGAGRLGSQLMQGHYALPAATAAAAATGVQRSVPGSSSISSSSSSTGSSAGSRRTPIDSLLLLLLPQARKSSMLLGSADILPARREGRGLQVLLMSECGVALEGLAWHMLPNNPNAPTDPSQLSDDLALRSPGHLHHLKVVHWCRCTADLLQRVLSDVSRWSADSLQEVRCRR